MVGLLFHVFYLLGKCIYDKYRVKRTRFLPDVANEAELFEQRDNTFDDVSGLENATWWTHRTINNFYPPAYMQRYCAVMGVLEGYKGKLYKVLTLCTFLLRQCKCVCTFNLTIRLFHCCLSRYC